jgi:hypothetical protein
VKDRFRIVKELFKEPDSLQLTYGKDTGVSEFNGKGKDPLTKHLIQTVDYSNIPIEYRFNSLGLRCPENTGKKTKMIFAGGSFCFGTGVNVEDTYAYLLAKKLDADYINLSDVDSLTELVEPLSKFKDYNPDYLVISDTRFISEIGWLRMYILDRTKEDNLKADPETKKFLMECFENHDNDVIKMFESYCRNLFPNAKLLFVYCQRKHFTRDIQFDHFTGLKITSEDVLDLARDNVHPGPKTHDMIARFLIKLLSRDS